MLATISRRRRIALACGTLVAALAAGAVLAPHGKAGSTAPAAAKTKLTPTTLACGDTVTKSTTLGNDLINCTGVGLTVSGNNVTLNLNGHEVDGTNANFSGIVVSGTGDTIEDGLVEQFQAGVFLNGASDRASGIHANSNEVGISSQSDNDVITASFASANTELGFADNGGAHTQVTNSWARANSIYGIQVLAAGATITGNKSLNNTSSGIVSGGATGILISGNTANGNGANGITGGGGTTISKNTTDFNTTLGVSATPYDTDGGGNKATGNGSLHQCANVVCS